MSEIITGVLKAAFGLIFDKARAYAAEKLKDGGLTDQKLRGLIVGKLDDIQSKLDASSRKDLFMSISCLQRGIKRLHSSFAESSEDGKTWTLELPSGQQSQQTFKSETKSAEHSTTVREAAVLANAIRKLKIESNERFVSAKQSFKKAEEKASEAFHNTALSIEERVLASKLRIASGILERVDDPEAAANDCLHYLEELHDMPALQEIVSVHFKGGVKALFKKDTREKIVKTLEMMNFILADFISKFTKKRMVAFDWPMIKCDRKRVVYFMALHHEEMCSTNMEAMKITPPWVILPKFQKHSCLIPQLAVVTNNGNLVCFAKCSRRCPQKLDRTTGQMETYSCSSENGIFFPVGMAVDKNDVLYVLSSDSTLSAYSADGKNIHRWVLTFLGNVVYKNVAITVTDDKGIVIACGSWLKCITVYLCTKTGELINSFDTGLNDDDREIKALSISSNSEIIVATSEKTVSNFSYAFHIFAEEELRKSIRVFPSEKGVGYNGIFYDHVSKNVISYVWPSSDKILIEYWSVETGELQYSYLLVLHCKSRSVGTTPKSV